MYYVHSCACWIILFMNSSTGLHPRKCEFQAIDLSSFPKSVRCGFSCIKTAGAILGITTLQPRKLAVCLE